MGKLKDGTMSFYRAAKEICRLYAKYGQASRIFAISPAFASAVAALTAACAAIEALDDFPFLIDQTTVPGGTGEDDVGGSTGGGI